MTSCASARAGAGTGRVGSSRRGSSLVGLLEFSCGIDEKEYFQRQESGRGGWPILADSTRPRIRRARARFATTATAPPSAKSNLARAPYQLKLKRAAGIGIPAALSCSGFNTAARF
jgi:hypothetical protein